ncbi:MAG: flagellar basal body rod protein FlgB, partial [Lachnospira sp.]|nr:flagellar basal body rod protein FlgB [Lachnospira sp.]
MSSGIFGYVNVLKSAADASWLREEVLSNNIANVDTPNYKRQDVEFKTYLNSAIEQSGKPNATLTQKINNVDLSNIKTR